MALLEENEFWQTQSRGTNDSEYQIYLSFCDEEFPKTYDEWLNS